MPQFLFYFPVSCELLLMQLADEVIDKLTFLDKNGSLQSVSDSKEKPVNVTQVVSSHVSRSSHVIDLSTLVMFQNLFKRAFGVKENVRVRFRNGRNHSFGEARIENHAFEDIRDEDL